MATDVAPKQPNYPISSVGNALRLLLMFKEQPRIRLSDAAKALGVSTSTAHRLLMMLQAHDFVRQDPEARTYVLGPVLLDLGLSAVRNMDVRVIARPILAELASRLDETVHLAVLEDTHVRYIFSIEGKHQLRIADRTGQVVPAHTSAIGRAFLADMPRDQLDKIMKNLEAEGVDVVALEAQLEQIREVGYALNYRPDDVTSLAMTLQDAQGRSLAAINAAGPSSRMSKQGQKQIARQLHAAAAQIEEALRAAS
ncbi:IclR family transcriptional regulator [Microbacterium sp. KRD172]|uniref:IclR family transcriptional regulator n=1 Tax=Microbacterium sp. KRD172 TaxID=2729727 RepID=UPI0019D29C94|nr:IclR family transcriptional regulator [Microbacterium sp. KRD172]